MDDCSIILFRELCFKDIEYELIKNILVGPESSINNGFSWKVKSLSRLDLDHKEWHMNDNKWKEHVIVSQATYR